MVEFRKGVRAALAIIPTVTLCAIGGYAMYQISNLPFPIPSVTIGAGATAEAAEAATEAVAKAAKAAAEAAGDTSLQNLKEIALFVLGGVVGTASSAAAFYFKADRDEN